MLTQQTFFLPFLGECVFPIVQDDNKISSDHLQKILLTDLPPNTRVIYWAAKESNTIFPNPWDAYNSNSYSTISNNDGESHIEIPCPSQYLFSKFGLYNRLLPKHIHYRYELPKYKGMFSKIFTKNVEC
jgi:hypothetical protein